jgi:integrase
MSQDVLELLKHRGAHQADQRELMGSDWRDTGLVFSTSLGTPIHPRNALRSFKRLIVPLDITPIRLHDLRHTHASLALQRGVPVEVVSERLGHARIDITLNTYRHLYDAERQAAALSLSDLLGGQQRVMN